MAEHEKVLHFTVLYRGKPLQLKAPASSTLGDLGKEIVDLTGVAPHTLRLMLPKRAPLQPMSEQHGTTLLYQSGITEGLTMRMMGVSLAEVAAVSEPSVKDRILGFSEEEQRARQRSAYVPGTYALPKGNYIFCDFQTLRLPGIELNPPPAMALKIMHKLASDRGITAIMNKYRWRVGVMTEMAPIGYVGISPKCILGYNKNRGQEISLRLRTDDLKGFRKYESIKKTLLHELAHMVHDEHDEKFHAMDKQLNEEAIALDWTKSQSQTLSGIKFEKDEEAMDSGGVGSSRGYRLGGNAEQASFKDARTAAGEAALRRLGNAMKKTPERARKESSQMTVSGVKPDGQSEPDPDEHGIESVVVIAEGKEGAVLDDIVERHPDEESDPDEPSNEHSSKDDPNSGDAVDSVRGALLISQEPDPDETGETVLKSQVRQQEPDPDAASMDDSRKIEPDPDEAMVIVLDPPVRTHEPDPDEDRTGQTGKREPDPDETVDSVQGVPVRNQEPDADESYRGASGKSEPHPDEAVGIVVENPVRSKEPDPDDTRRGESCKDEPDPDEGVDIVPEAPVRREERDSDVASSCHSGKNEPDPDDAMDIVLGDSQLRAQEPDPDEAINHAGKKEPDPDDPSDSSTEEMDFHAYMGCSCTANKKMKSGNGSEFKELAEPQLSR